MMVRNTTASMAARPGLTRRCLTSSLTYRVPSQPVKMNTETRNPAARLPLPPIPVGLSQPLEKCTVPCQWLATAQMPTMAKTMRIVYSTTAMATWDLAVNRMPTTAMISMTTPTAVPIAMFDQVLVELDPNTASTEGPSTSTPLTVAMMYAAIISQPVRKPR